MFYSEKGTFLNTFVTTQKDCGTCMVPVPELTLNVLYTCKKVT
jgi:hypothetical protein